MLIIDNGITTKAHKHKKILWIKFIESSKAVLSLIVVMLLSTTWIIRLIDVLIIYYDESC